MANEQQKTFTYRELADALSISRDGAKSLARRRVQAGRWQRYTGNDGTVRIQVPPDDPVPTPGTDTGATPGRTTPGSHTGVSTGEQHGVDTRGWQTALDQASARITELREALDRERQRADQAETALTQERQARQAAERDRDQARAQLAQPRPGLLARILGRT